MLKERNKGVVKCRICKEDHWTTNCPYKDTLGPLRDSLAGKEAGDEDESAAPGGTGGPTSSSTAGPGAAAVGSSGGKYVPPSRRGGEGALQRLGESMPDRRRSESSYLRVRVPFRNDSFSIPCCRRGYRSHPCVQLVGEHPRG